MPIYNQDADLDADEGTQTARRIAGPDATMASHNEATLDLPITLTATQAMTVALRQLYGAWLERVMHQWQTDWTHLDLEPGDVVQVALHDGSLFAVRLLQCELGANLAVSWQTVVEESSSYTVPAVPAAALNHIPRAEPVSSEAKLFLLDLPLLQDLDDVQRVATGTYWAGGAWFDPPWKGAMLFSSDDGAVYASVDETFAAVSWGAAINALSDTDTPFQTDATSELRVAMVSGALASVTALEMLNGANRAALIRSDGVAEIIQFEDAVLADGIYTVTNLLRGRRGTEVFTGGHAAGDLFVLLDGVSRRGLPLSRIGQTLHHRLVGRGGELRDAATNIATLAGRDLMPYAPAHLTLAGEVGGGDIEVSWVRRTRVGGALLGGTGDVPVSEDEELYELVVHDGADTVLRTVTDLSSPAFTYTAAMQAEDFPGGGPGRIAVWQISAQVGRGFEADAALAFGFGFFVGGEPDAAGSCGFDWAFTDFQTYAQRYTAGAAGSLTSVSVYFNETDTPDVRVGIYSDNAGLPDTLLAEGTGTASGAVGWHEIALSSSVAVADTDVFWVAVQVSASIDSCAPSSAVNSGRQRNSTGHASGLAAPFGASSSFINTRGVRYTIEVAP